MWILSDGGGLVTEATRSTEVRRASKSTVLISQAVSHYGEGLNTTAPGWPARHQDCSSDLIERNRLDMTQRPPSHCSKTKHYRPLYTDCGKYNKHRGSHSQHASQYRTYASRTRHTHKHKHVRTKTHTHTHQFQFHMVWCDGGKDVRVEVEVGNVVRDSPLERERELCCLWRLLVHLPRGPHSRPCLPPAA